MIISHLPSDLFHKIHMKSKEIILFVKKKVIIRKVSFIHSDIEELANNQSKKVQLKKTTTLL